MGRTFKIVCCVAFAAVVLAGCRYGSTYTINADDTVTGRIYTAAYQYPAEEPVNDSIESDANSIAASFTTSSITPHNEGNWIGYFVYFNNEPLATFADPPTTTWDVQIVKSGTQYQVFGYTATEESFARESATEDSGYLELDVYFPGTLAEQSYATESNVALGWVHFNLLSQPLNTTPYAKGNSPAAPPEPEPVQTIIIVPEPDPVVTPLVTPSASPSPNVSPSGVPLVDDSDNSIPVWVWVVGGILVAALAGMTGFALANRKPPVPQAPVAKTKAKPAPVEEEVVEEEGDDEEPEEEAPSPKKK